MVIPDFLKEGDWLGVAAPSDGISKVLDWVRLDNAVRRLEGKGLRVIESPSVRCSVKGRSNGAEARAKEWMDLVRDSRVRAIIAATGGDFLMEVLPHLDFELIACNPKWMQGYSDVTGLLFTVTTLCGVATIYGGNVKDFGMADWHASIEGNWDVLCGRYAEQRGFDLYEGGFYDRVTGLEGYVLEKPVCWRNARGEDSLRMDGVLLGGCLDVLLNLVGTRFDRVEEFLGKEGNGGVLWYLESYDLGSEALERGLWQLREAGWFDAAKGFVFGRPAMFGSETDTSYREAVLNAVGAMDVPIVLDADIGHMAPRLTVVNGMRGQVESVGGRGVLRMMS